MDNARKIWDRLISAGFTLAGAAGLMGNLYAESGLSPINLENSFEKKLGFTDASYTAAVDSGVYTNFAKDGAGYGLAQWTHPDRKPKLLAFVKAAGKSVGDLEAQLDFLVDELARSYPAVLNTLKATNSVRTASDIVLLKYERPADQSEAVKVKRAGYGQVYYDRYAGKEDGMSRDPLEVARGELGNTEAPAGSNRTKYGKWMGMDGQPWCMSFVQYCFYMAGYPLPYKTGSCSALLNWYKKNKPECIVTAPKPRDIVIYSFGHTGILESAAAGTVTVVEGNTSAGAAGSQDNGGGVFTRTRSKALVQAYIRPFENYEEDDNMKYFKTLQDVPDSYRPTIRKLMEKGALRGVSDPDPTRLDDNILNISEDLCRTLKVLDNLGKLD